ncbi:CARDB domain-containing protein [Hymenobacter sp. ASUV-10]|uniref:CARDB domain-containing protein n=1 Tax=Hymenobacter aranciens TaxID=3063996 RepID=A0ABT9BF44_9BACT|nr:CARDB domain-containing protein [Hymenobacter sp. ASUV-10]MDO7876857.1 CARDB domain-containing protein [Hymenobacter sp. ASUV-10]
MKHLFDFARRLGLLVILISFALSAVAQLPGNGGSTGGPPGGNGSGGTGTPGGPGNGGTTGGPPGPNATMPSISGFTPASGPIGTVVTVTGSNLTGATAVAINGVNAPVFTVGSATQLTVTVPTGATTGQIAVTTASGTALSTNSFVVLVPPTISSFTPTSGAVGTSVTLTGTGFTGATAVAFNGTAATTFTVVSATSITATVPASASTGPLTVTTPSGTGTSASSFTVLTAPTISSFTPTSGPAGTSVTLTGTNLGGATSVTFGGVAATGSITGNTATSLTVAAPAGAPTGPICVTTAQGTGCSASNYTFPLIITTGAVSPTSFCAGATITVPFTTSMAGYGPGNAFQLQLSDASGVFSSGNPLFGTLISSGSAGGTLSGTVPNTIAGGTGYRVRVVASDPATVGTANATDLTINTTPVSQAGGPASVPYGSTIALTLTPTYAGATYAWSGPLGFSSNLQNPTVPSNTNVGVNRYTCLVTLGGCSFSSFVDVTVQAATAPLLSLTAFAGPLCPATAFAMTFNVAGVGFAAGNTITAQLSDASGSFASPMAIGTVAFSGLGNGTISGTLPAATAGTSGYRIRLVGSNPAATSNTNGSDLTVTAPPAVTLAALAPVCINSAAFTLTGGSPAGGTYRVDGTVAGSFNPAAAGVGTYTITYTYTAGTSCSATATRTLEVRALPTVTLAAQAPRCYQAAAFTLTGGSPAGGTYSGPGVSSGQFNATTAGVGTHTITYTYADGAGCSSTATQPLPVLPLPTFSASATSTCTGQPVTLTVSNAGPGASYLWSPGGETTASISPAPTVATTYSVVVTNAAGCTYPFSQAVSINPATAAPGVVSQMQPIDGSNGLSLPITFTWSPGGNTSTYDLYVWPASGTQPATPTASGLTNLQYTFNGSIPYGAQYRWRVVARNACFATPGPVFAFGLRELPDLRVSFIQNPDTVYAGQTMQMSWNVTNTGLGSTLAQQWRDDVWLSQDSVFNTDTAIRVGDWGNTTFLQPNGTYITNATFTVPYSQAGYYYVFVRANANGQLLETDYLNNRRRSPKRTLMIVPQTPDFSLENFVSPPDPSVGYTDVQLRYRVYNRGPVTVTVPRFDEFFISPDTILNISQNTGRLSLGPNAISLSRQRVTDTLATNEFYDRIVSVRIPHTEFGTRYFYAYTDTDNVVFETASTNNVNSPEPVQIILRPPADLQPIALTAPSNALAGNSFTVTWDVKNGGLNAPVPEERYWSDQFWLCPSATFDPGTAIAVGSTSVFGGDTLAVNHHYRRTVTLNIPNGISGNYYVYGYADYVSGSTRGNVFEYNFENNNLRRSAQPVAVGLTYADLQPTAFTGPADVDAFQTFTVNYTVRNNSGAVGAAGGTWTDAIYLVTPGGGPNCLLLGTATRIGPLAVGASYSGSMTLTIPRSVTPGNYELLLHTDSGNSVYEFNFENNNERRHAFTYHYSDDLRLTVLSTTGTAFSGQTIGLSWSVDNQGAFRTLATGWQDQFFLSTDATLDNSDLLLSGVTRNGDLAVGSSYNGTVTVRLPHGLQGNFFVIGKAGVPDGRGYCNSNVSSVLVDTNPGNNFRSTALPITLTPPADLLPTTYTLPTDVVAGQQVTVPFTIRNQGVGATLEGDWDDAIYLSTSPSVNGAIRIGTYRHAGTLGAGASYSVALPVTIPAYLSGNYYIFLVADQSGVNGYYPTQLWGGAIQYGTVYEHQQELNNVVQGNILIRVPEPADLVVTSVTLPANRVLGQTMTVHYQVRNQGINPAVGQLKDGLYLSQDATMDGAVDQLFASRTQNVAIAPSQTINGVVRSRLQGILPGNYHGLMATNLFNDIYEGPVSSPAANNNITDAGNLLSLGVNTLPLRTPTSFPLMADSIVYYRVTPGANKDMVLTLTSTQSLGQNEMYVAYNRVPTAADYDFIYLNQVSTSQEILVPTTGAGPYYVLVKTPYAYPSLQTATLYADTLGFQVRSIAANRVGQGRVTTQVLGAGFRRTPATRFFLTKGLDPTIRAEAQVLRFRNSTEVTLRWRLDTLSVGVYNVVAANGAVRVQLTDGLTVETARPLDVDFATIIPQTIRAGANGNWTYFLQNNSNLDVPYWEFQYDLPPGLNPVITHTPNVRKKSDFTNAAASATPRNRLDDGLTEVLPFIAQDLRPGEIIQVNLRLTANLAVNQFLPVVWNQAALTEEWYTRQTLDHIARYRAAVLAAPAQYPAGVASLAASASAWTDSLTRYYTRLGLVDTTWLRLNPQTGYTARSVDIAIPGGMCGTTGVTECVRPFRPNPFDGNTYPPALVGCADSIVFTYKGRGLSCTLVVGSADPNLIVGPNGVGTRKMVGVQTPLNYQVQFENDPALATAPAQVVRVTVPLGPASDPRTFRLGSFGWDTLTFQVPANSSTYSATLDMPDSLGYDVRVLGTVDVVGRQLIWRLETIDPATGVAPLDPNKGFLALNDSTGRGQGFLNYIIQGSATAATGDTLAAQASIVFDVNPPIATNRWVNILDAGVPVSQVNTLPATQPGNVVSLTWTASDDAGGSGLRAFDIYASQDGGAFTRVAQDVPGLSYTFTGLPNTHYDFFTLAVDSTDNREALKTVAEAGITLGSVLPDLVVSALQTLPGGSYRNVTITGTLHLSADLLVTGTLTVQSGGVLSTLAPGGAACAAITGAGNFVLAAGGTLRICDAAGISASGATGSIQLSGTRSFSDDATYVYDGLAPQQTGAGLPDTVRNLRNVSQPLTLTQPVAVAQVLEVNANFSTNSQALTLLSSAAGTALVAYNGTTNPTMTGPATVQRWIDPSQNAGAGYRHYSSPVLNAPFADLQTPGFVPTLTTSYNTSATPGNVTPFPTVFGYDEARIPGSVATGFSAFDKGWEVPTTSTLTLGRGYTVNIPASEKVDFVGALNNAPVSLPLSFTPSAEAGWHLVGNPFAAPLDWSLVTRPAGLDAALYVFGSTGQYTGQYRSYVNGVGLGSPVVPSGQGFFVRASAPATLILNNSHRIREFRTTDPAFQRSTADLRPQLHLSLRGSTGPADDAYLYAEVGASPAVESAFDAVKLANPSGLNLGSLVGNEALAINGLAPAQLAATTSIPLQVGVPAVGAYTLTAAGLLNWPATTAVELYDALTGQRTDLRQQPAYAFTVSAATLNSATGRFWLNLAPAAPLGTAPAFSAATVQLFPNPAHQQVRVLLPATAGSATVQAELLNSLGQRVTQTAVALQPAGTSFLLPLDGLAAGVYTLRLHAGATIVTKRLVVE